MMCSVPKGKMSVNSSRLALVLWVKENETSILDESFVLDKEMLTDTERVGLVQHGTKAQKPPKEGWLSYEARVLGVSHDPKKLRALEKEWWKNMIEEESEDDSVSIRRPVKKPKRFEDFEEEEKRKEKDIQRVKKRKADEAVKRAQADLLDEMERGLSDVDEVESDDDDALLMRWSKPKLIDHITSLEEKYANAKGEIKRLTRLNLQLQEGLSRTIEEKIEEAFSKTSRISSPPLPRPSPSSRPMFTPPTAKPSPSPSPSSRPPSARPSPGPSSTQSPSPRPSTSPMPSPFDRPASPDFCDETQDATTAVLDNMIDSRIKAELRRAPDFRKLTRNLLTVLFTDEELKTSSVTGKKGNGKDVALPALNKEKRALLIEYVQSKFPNAESTSINQVMAQKVRDVKIPKDN